MTQPPRLLNRQGRLGAPVGVYIDHNLPPTLSREIGRIIVKFAALEYVTSQAIYSLLDIDRQSGRIAVREPRLIERLDMIFDLAKERSITLSVSQSEFRTKLEAISAARDSLAHGVWTIDAKTGRHLLVKTRGSWVPEPRLRIKRTLNPQSHEVLVDDLRQVWRSIEAALAVINLIGDEIVAARPPSLDTPLARSHPTGRWPGPSAERPTPQPKPSQAKPKSPKLSSAQKRALRGTNEPPSDA